MANTSADGVSTPSDNTDSNATVFDAEQLDTVDTQGNYVVNQPLTYDNESTAITPVNYNYQVAEPDAVAQAVEGLGAEIKQTLDILLAGNSSSTWTTDYGDGYITLDPKFKDYYYKLQELWSLLLGIAMIGETKENIKGYILQLFKGPKEASSRDVKYTEIINKGFRHDMQGPKFIFTNTMNYIHDKNNAEYDRKMLGAQASAQGGSSSCINSLLDFIGLDATHREYEEKYTAAKEAIDRAFKDVQASLTDTLKGFLDVVIEERKRRTADPFVKLELNYLDEANRQYLMAAAGDNGYGNSYYDLNKDLAYAILHGQTIINDLRKAYYMSLSVKEKLKSMMIEIMSGITSDSSRWNMVFDYLKYTTDGERTLLLANINQLQLEIEARNKYAYSVWEHEKAKEMLDSMWTAFGICLFCPALFFVASFVEKITDVIYLLTIEDFQYTPTRINFDNVEEALNLWGISMKSICNNILDQLDKEENDLIMTAYNGGIIGVGDGFKALNEEYLNSIGDKLESIDNLRKAYMLVMESKARLVMIALYAATGQNPLGEELPAVEDSLVTLEDDMKVAFSLVMQSLRDEVEENNKEREWELEKEKIIGSFFANMLGFIIGGMMGQGLFDGIYNIMYLLEHEKPELYHEDDKFYDNKTERRITGNMVADAISDIATQYRGLVDQLTTGSHINVGDDMWGNDAAQITALSDEMSQLFMLGLGMMQIETTGQEIIDLMLQLMGRIGWTARHFQTISNGLKSMNARYMQALQLKTELVRENISAHNARTQWEKQLDRAMTNLWFSAVKIIMEIVAAVLACTGVGAIVAAVIIAAIVIMQAYYNKKCAEEDKNSGYGDLDRYKTNILDEVLKIIDKQKDQGRFDKLYQSLKEILSQATEDLIVSTSDGYVGLNQSNFYIMRREIDMAYNAATASQEVMDSQRRIRNMVLRSVGGIALDAQDYTLMGIQASKEVSTTALQQLFDTLHTYVDRMNQIRDAEKALVMANIMFIISIVKAVISIVAACVGAADAGGADAGGNVTTGGTEGTTTPGSNTMENAEGLPSKDAAKEVKNDPAKNADTSGKTQVQEKEGSADGTYPVDGGLEFGGEGTTGTSGTSGTSESQSTQPNQSEKPQNANKQETDAQKEAREKQEAAKKASHLFNSNGGGPLSNLSSFFKGKDRFMNMTNSNTAVSTWAQKLLTPAMGGRAASYVAKALVAVLFSDNLAKMIANAINKGNAKKKEGKNLNIDSAGGSANAAGGAGKAGGGAAAKPNVFAMTEQLQLQAQVDASTAMFDAEAFYQQFLRELDEKMTLSGLIKEMIMSIVNNIGKYDPMESAAKGIYKADGKTVDQNLLADAKNNLKQLGYNTDNLTQANIDKFYKIAGSIQKPGRDEMASLYVNSGSKEQINVVVGTDTGKLPQFDTKTNTLTMPQEFLDKFSKASASEKLEMQNNFLKSEGQALAKLYKTDSANFQKVADAFTKRIMNAKESQILKARDLVQHPPNVISLLTSSKDQTVSPEVQIKPADRTKTTRSVNDIIREALSASALSTMPNALNNLALIKLIVPEEQYNKTAAEYAKITRSNVENIKSAVDKIIDDILTDIATRVEKPQPASRPVSKPAVRSEAINVKQSLQNEVMTLAIVKPEEAKDKVNQITTATDKAVKANNVTSASELLSVLSTIIDRTPVSMTRSEKESVSVLEMAAKNAQNMASKIVAKVSTSEISASEAAKMLEVLPAQMIVPAVKDMEPSQAAMIIIRLEPQKQQQVITVAKDTNQAVRAAEIAERIMSKLMTPAVNQTPAAARSDRSNDTVQTPRASTVAMSSATMLEDITLAAEITQVQTEVNNATAPKANKAEMMMLSAAVRIKRSAEVAERASLNALDTTTQLNALKKPMEQLLTQIAAKLQPTEAKKAKEMISEIKGASFTNTEDVVNFMDRIKDLASKAQVNDKVKEVIAQKLTRAKEAVENTSDNVKAKEVAIKVVANIVRNMPVDQVVQAIRSKPNMIDKMARMIPIVIEQSEKPVKPENVQQIVIALEQVKTSDPRNIPVSVAIDKAIEKIIQNMKTAPQAIIQQPQVETTKHPAPAVTRPQVQEEVQKAVSLVISKVAEGKITPEEAATALNNVPAEVTVRAMAKASPEAAAMVIVNLEPGKRHQVIAMANEKQQAIKAVVIAENTRRNQVSPAGIQAQPIIMQDSFRNPRQVEQAPTTEASKEVSTDEEFTRLETDMIRAEMSNMKSLSKASKADTRIVSTVIVIKNGALAAKEASQKAVDPATQLNALKKPMEQLLTQIAEKLPQTEAKKAKDMSSEIKKADFTNTEKVARFISQVKDMANGAKINEKVKEVIAQKLTQAMEAVDNTSVNVRAKDAAQKAVNDIVNNKPVEDVVRAITSKPNMIDKVARMIPAVIEHSEKKVNPENMQQIVIALEEVKAAVPNNIRITVALDKAIEKITQKMEAAPQAVIEPQVKTAVQAAPVVNKPQVKQAESMPTSYTPVKEAQHAPQAMNMKPTTEDKVVQMVMDNPKKAEDVINQIIIVIDDEISANNTAAVKDLVAVLSKVSTDVPKDMNTNVVVSKAEQAVQKAVSQVVSKVIKGEMTATEAAKVLDVVPTQMIVQAVKDKEPTQAAQIILNLEPQKQHQVMAIAKETKQAVKAVEIAENIMRTTQSPVVINQAQAAIRPDTFRDDKQVSRSSTASSVTNETKGVFDENEMKKIEAEINADKNNKLNNEDASILRIAIGIKNRADNAKRISASGNETEAQIKSLKKPIEQFLNSISAKLDPTSAANAKNIIYGLKQKNFSKPEEAQDTLTQVKALVTGSNIKESTKQLVISKLENAVESLQNTSTNITCKQAAQTALKLLEGNASNDYIAKMILENPAIAASKIIGMISTLTDKPDINVSMPKLLNLVSTISNLPGSPALKDETDKIMRKMFDQINSQLFMTATVKDPADQDIVKPKIEQVAVSSILTFATKESAKVALSQIIANGMGPEETAKFLRNFKPEVAAYILSVLETKDAIAVLSQLALVSNSEYVKKAILRVDNDSIGKDLKAKIEDMLNSKDSNTICAGSIKKIDPITGEPDKNGNNNFMC
ncbi:MAG: hypothetical protein NTZ10_03715 [Candidatus Saganbacteria bacterium]|nr:hypothetical protein [Candidatus Saganbacteria bacterium]